ncbi:branched-chain amino acid ABC transporter permease [Paenirhodobacter populi]|uniref:Branched-chain amino acid ABC transporter permease n=1 Tax=Paenirhodobacter populi TaxID=2306993 RepID=A0A443J7A9_9RHOB|nr:branched-chain amino acid ABC transporter permease [Sinirhodobacter populi]RWR16289.1 branched-chain amino acid ABC transporter permease [Sinirhodobacter populi]
MLKKLVAVIAVLALLLALPALLSESMLNASVQMLIAALFATAFALLCGQAGMLSFGHAAYFGLGAFATVHAMNAFGGDGLLPTPLMPLAGAAIGLISGLGAGYFSTQRTGTYFAMITLALAELLHALAPHLKEVFGGEAGISSFRMPAWGFEFGSTIEIYYLVLGWTVLCIALLWGLTLTPFGRLVLGLRENSHRLKFLGYNTHALGTFVFALSAAFAGVAGALQALNIEAANYVVLETQVSTAVLLNTFIGGAKVFFGPAIGAAAMTFFGHVTSDLTRSWLLYQGIIFMLVMMYLPRGIVGEILARFRGEGGAVNPVAVLARFAGILVAAAGFVMAIELTQRFFSTDYKAARQAGGWPAVEFAGHMWAPFAPLTWALPIVLIAAGLGLVTFINRREARRQEAQI